MAAIATEPPPGGVVVDCSVALAWFLLDETNALAERISARIDRLEIWVPPLWRYELTNGLDVARRRGRLAPESWREAIRAAEEAPVRVDPTVPGAVELAELAAAHGLTTYDAAYLELALRRRIPLATTDADLAAAATALRVLFDPEIVL
jgi:predicted nucleic acid-binding protein